MTRDQLTETHKAILACLKEYEEEEIGCCSPLRTKEKHIRPCIGCTLHLARVELEKAHPHLTSSHLST